MEDNKTKILEKADNAFNAGLFSRAIELYKQALDAGAPGELAKFGIAESLQALGLYDESIELYNEILDVDEENDLAWNGKGVSLFYLGEYGRAKLCFEIALDLEPGNVGYQASIAEMAIMVGEHDEALEQAELALKKAETPEEIVLPWAFSIIAYMLDGNLGSALATLNEFMAYLEKTERDLLPENDFKGADYELGGLKSIMHQRLQGASKNIIGTLIRYLEGEIDFEDFKEVVDMNVENITTDDIKPPPEGYDDEIGVSIIKFPDLSALVEPRERACLEEMDSIIQDFEGNEGFMSFNYIFSLYDWNLDRGPAPFIVEIENKFFIQIENGHARKLAFDLGVLERAGYRGCASITADASGGSGNEQGQVLELHLPGLEELFITSKHLEPVIETLRRSSYGKHREFYLYLKLTGYRREDDPFTMLERIPEAWEIDEIPADFQEDPDVHIYTMAWRV